MTHRSGTRVPKQKPAISRVRRKPDYRVRHRAGKLMTTKVLKLLNMEADAKANESAAASSSATATTAGEGGGGGGGTAPATESEFYNTGRVGRRNALPDILNHHHSTTSTADLPDKLSALSTSDGGGPSDGSGSGPPKQ